MEIKEQLRAALTSANVLYAKANRTPEEDTALDAALKSAHDLKAQIERGDQLTALDDFAQKSAPDPMAGLSAKVDSLMQRFEDAPALKNAGFVSQDGGAADKNLKSFSDFLFAVKRRDTKRLGEVYGSYKADANGDSTKAAMAEDAGITGGYLVPKEYVAELLEVAGEEAIVRPRAYIQPMKGRQVEIPFLNQTTAPTAGDSAFSGGVVSSWTEEASALTQTEPNFKMMQLTAHKLGGFSYVSNEMMADSAQGVDTLLKRLFGRDIAFKEDYAFLRGNGVGKPLGQLLAPANIAVTRTGGSQDFDLADVGLMLRRFLPTSVKRGVWIMHPYVISSLMVMATTSTVTAFITNMQDGLPMRLMGMPILFSEKLVASGTAGDVLLSDFSYYVIGERGALSIAFSEHARFTNDQTTWRYTHRVDGQPWLDAAITLADASSTVSPFISLS